MSGDEEKLLRDAVARNGGAVLSVPSLGILRHGKSRLLAEFEGGILLEAVPDQEEIVQKLIESREMAIVSFKSGVYKAVFGSCIIKFVPQFKVNEVATLDGVLLEFPKEIKAVQRRISYRATVPMDGQLSARVWKIADRAYLRENPPRAQEVLCELRDLSVGGMGVRFFSKDRTLPKVCPEDRLRIVVKAGGEEPLILEGRMREGREAPDGSSLITGISFKKLEANLEGRQNLATLTRLVGELQRDELRQFRMGLANAG